MMQASYKSKGWLGLTMGTRMYYSFHVPELDDDAVFESRQLSVQRGRRSWQAECVGVRADSGTGTGSGTSYFVGTSTGSSPSAACDCSPTTGSSIAICESARGGDAVSATGERTAVTSGIAANVQRSRVGGRGCAPGASAR